MSYGVYILFSEKDKHLYVGQSNDIDKRLARHNAGQVNATKYRRPLVCIHREHFETRSEAMKRESFLKSLWGARTKKKILNNYLESIRPNPSEHEVL